MIFTLLKVLGIILLALLLLVFLILFVPAAVRVEYDRGKLNIYLRVLLLRFHVFPLKKKKKKSADPSSKSKFHFLKHDKKNLKNKKDAEEANSPEKNEKRPDYTERLRKLVCIVQQACFLMKWVFKALSVRKVDLTLPVHAGDAAKTAVQYGYTNAAVFTLLAAVDSIVKLDVYSVRIYPVYLDVQQDETKFSCNVYALLIIIIIAALYSLYKLYKNKIIG